MPQIRYVTLVELDFGAIATLPRACADAGIARNLNAGYVLKNLGEILVGELADVFCFDDFDEAVGIALLIERASQ